MIQMNDQQIKGAARWLIAVSGASLAGYFAARGWMTKDQAMDMINSETFMFALTTLIPLVWSMVAKTRRSLMVIAGRVRDRAGRKLVTNMNLTDASVAADINRAVDATVTSGR